MQTHSKNNCLEDTEGTRLFFPQFLPGTQNARATPFPDCVSTCTVLPSPHEPLDLILSTTREERGVVAPACNPNVYIEEA